MVGTASLQRARAASTLRQASSSPEGRSATHESASRAPAPTRGSASTRGARRIRWHAWSAPIPRLRKAPPSGHGQAVATKPSPRDSWIAMRSSDRTRARVWRRSSSAAVGRPLPGPPANTSARPSRTTPQADRTKPRFCARRWSASHSKRPWSKGSLSLPPPITMSTSPVWASKVALRTTVPPRSRVTR